MGSSSLQKGVTHRKQTFLKLVSDFGNFRTILSSKTVDAVGCILRMAHLQPGGGPTNGYPKNGDGSGASAAISLAASTCAKHSKYLRVFLGFAQALSLKDLTTSTSLPSPFLGLRLYGHSSARQGLVSLCGCSAFPGHRFPAIPAPAGRP